MFEYSLQANFEIPLFLVDSIFDFNSPTPLVINARWM